MLAALLPGLRDLRAPVAAGYLWLFGLWLVFAPHLEPSAHPTGVVHDVVTLGNAAGRAAVTAAVTFAAYLVGVVSIAANPLINRLGNLLAATRLRRFMPRAQWQRVRATIISLVYLRIDERFLADGVIRAETARRLHAVQVAAGAHGTTLAAGFEADPDIVIEQARTTPAVRARLLDALLDTAAPQEECRLDLLRTPVRIVGREADIYAAYDRYRAEYELRMGLVLPVTFLIGTLAVMASPWWTAGIFVSAMLLYLGVAANIQASTVLTESVGARRIDLPTLERLATHDLPWRDQNTALSHLAEQ